MSQSLAKVYLHIIFTTKNHQKFIDESIREKLQAYMVGVNSKNGSYSEEIYANPDHVHILCTLPRVITIAKLIYNIKTSSSKWMKAQGFSTFDWQDGYAVFSVSASKVPAVKEYILNQPQHHKKVPVKNELREFFRYYGIDFDERYVWD